MKKVGAKMVNDPPVQTGTYNGFMALWTDHFGFQSKNRVAKRTQPDKTPHYANFGNPRLKYFPRLHAIYDDCGKFRLLIDSLFIPVHADTSVASQDVVSV